MANYLSIVMLRAVCFVSSLACIGIMITESFFLHILLHASFQTGKPSKMVIIEKVFLFTGIVGHMILAIIIIVSMLDLSWFSRFCGIVDSWLGRGVSMIYLGAEAGSNYLLLEEIFVLKNTKTTVLEKMGLTSYILSWFLIGAGILFFILGVFHSRESTEQPMYPSLNDYKELSIATT